MGVNVHVRVTFALHAAGGRDLPARFGPHTRSANGRMKSVHH